MNRLDVGYGWGIIIMGVKKGLKRDRRSGEMIRGRQMGRKPVIFTA